MIKTILFSLLAMLFFSGCVQRGFEVDPAEKNSRIKRVSTNTISKERGLQKEKFEQEQRNRAAATESVKRAQEAKRLQENQMAEKNAQRTLALEEKNRAVASESIRRAQEAKRLQESQIEEAKRQEAIRAKQQHRVAATASIRRAEEAKRLQDMKLQKERAQRAINLEQRRRALDAEAIRKVQEAKKFEQKQQAYKKEKYAKQAANYSNQHTDDSGSFSFIGITTSQNTLQFDNDADDDQDEKTFGIRYGQQTLDWRTMFTYESKNDGLTTMSLEADKILLDSLFGSPKLRPYLGLSVGKIEYDNSDIVDDLSGYFYGVNLGFIIYATDTTDLDISYHYYEVKELDNIDILQGTGISLHYFF